MSDWRPMFPWELPPQGDAGPAAPVPPPFTDELAGAPDAPQAPAWLVPPPAPQASAPAPLPPPQAPPPVAPELAGPPHGGPQAPAWFSPPVNGNAAPPPPHGPPPIPVDPEAQNIVNIGALRAKQQEIEASGAQGAANTYADTVQKNARTAEQEQRIAADTEQHVRDTWDTIGKMKINPDHWWESRSTGQKVATFIGAALGGFLAVRNGSGKNSFMEGINDAIHQDIAVQEANIANARSAAAGQQSLYGMMLQRFGSADTARAATAATMYDAAIKKTLAQAAGLNSPITQEETQRAVFELGKQRDAARAATAQLDFKNRIDLDEQGRKDAETRSVIAKNYADAAKTRAEANKGPDEKEQLKVVPNLLVPETDERGRPVMQYQEVQAPDGSPLKPTPEMNQRTGKPLLDAQGKPIYKEVIEDKSGATTVEQVEVGKDAKGKPVYEDRVVKVVPKRTMHKARSADESKEIAETVAGYREYQAAVREMQDISKTYGREWFKTSEGTQLYKQAREHMIFATQHMYGVKRMTDTDLKTFRDDIPDPGSSWSISNGEKALKNAAKFGREKFRTRLDSMGVPPNAVMEGDEPDTEDVPIDLSKPENWQHPTADQRADAAYKRQEEIKARQQLEYQDQRANRDGIIRDLPPPGMRR